MPTAARTEDTLRLLRVMRALFLWGSFISTHPHTLSIADAPRRLAGVLLLSTLLLLKTACLPAVAILTLRI